LSIAHTLQDILNLYIYSLRVPGFSRGKERPGREADPSPLLVPLVMKE